MRAEYDFDNNRVTAVEMEDGRVVLTQNPRVLGAKTGLLPVVVTYPDGYDGRFHDLLRPLEVRYEYDAQDNVVRVTYPQADFSPTALRDRMATGVRGSARVKLAETDWYFIRQIETGEPVPAEVLEQRTATRQLAEERLQELADLAEAELPNFDPGLDTVKPGPANEPVTAPVPGGDGTEWVTDASSPSETGTPVEPVEQPTFAPPLENPGTGLDWEIEK